ncbi:MAG: glycosyltransferase [Planctomycetia bacterium]|nr:glycosyltransferase [Planctomycetia bacterium]
MEASRRGFAPLADDREDAGGVAQRSSVGISLVLPAFNEEESIAQAIREADQALARLTKDYEVIVVDDGSGDATLAVAHAAAKQTPAVRIVAHGTNTGYGAALRSGFRAATKEYVAFTDADGQFDLAELDRLAMLAPHYHLVCGYRIDRQDPWRRRFFAWGYNLLTRALLGTRIRDCDCALKLARRDAVAGLDLESDGFFINAELLAKSRLADLSVVEVGVTHRRRELGHSKVSLRQIVPVLTAVLRFWWTRILFPAQDARHPELDATTSAVRPWHAALLVVAAILLMFSRLTYPLIEPDEARYALIASEMLDTGEWLIPTRDGQHYLDKPPLLYWLTAASYCVFGVHDFAARVVTAVASLGTLAATWWLGRRLVGPRAALAAVVLLLLSVGFVVSGRFLIMDGLLTLFMTVCFLAQYLATRGPALDRRWWLVSAVACGLGVMTKGPVALVLAVPPLVALRWVTGRGAPLRRAHWLQFGGIVAAIAMPWFIAAAIREPDFFEYFVWKHHIQRFATKSYHAEPWWFYAPALTVGMLPASLLLPLLGYYLFGRSATLRGCRTEGQGYLLLAAAWTVGFFSISAGKLATYILPAIPMLCLLAGAMLDKAIFTIVPDRAMDWVRRRLPFHAARLALISGVVVGLLDAVIDGFAPVSLVVGSSVIAASIVLFVLVSRPSFAARPARWLAAAAIPLVVMAFGLIDIYPQIAAQRSTALQVARFRQEHGENTMPVVSFLRYEDSVVFYNRDSEVVNYDLQEIGELLDYLIAHERALLIAPANGIAMLRARLPASVILREQPGARGYLYLSLSRDQGAARLSAGHERIKRQ